VGAGRIGRDCRERGRLRLLRCGHGSDPVLVLLATFAWGPTMFLLLTLLVACTGGPPSTADSAGADTGLVPVQGGDPDGFSQVKTLFFTIFFETWDPTSKRFTQGDAALSVSAFKTPVWLPLPSSEVADACWRRHSITLGGDQVDLGKQVVVSFGDDEITLPGPNDERRLKSDDALAAAVPGASASLEGQDTSLIVPDPMTAQDLAGSVADLAADSVLHLRWEPSDLPGFMEVQAVDHNYIGIWCALHDDGSADIDLRDVAQTAETVSISHISRGTFDHTVLGKTFVDVEQRETVDVP